MAPDNRPSQFRVENLALIFLRFVFVIVAAGLGVRLVNSDAVEGQPYWVLWLVFGGVMLLAFATIGVDVMFRHKRLDVITAQKAVHETTGRHPNVAIVSIDAWRVVRYNPTIVNAVFPGGGGGGMVSQGQFAEFLGVNRVLVGEAVYNSAAKGLTGSYTPVWSNTVTLAHVAERPGLRQPSFMYQFNWTGGKLSNGGPGNFNVFTMEDEKAGRTDIWTGYYADEKVVAPELGAVINTHVGSTA